MKITITHNGFHGYRTCTLSLLGNPGERVELSPSQVKKLARAACGSPDCRCGESMLGSAVELIESRDCRSPDRAFLTIPIDGDEIRVDGHYPQR